MQLGGVIVVLSTLMIGHPNLVFPTMPTTETYAWIAACFQGFGNGLIMIGSLPLALVILERFGMNKASVANPMGALQAMMFSSSTLLTLPVTAIIQAGGERGVSIAAITLAVVHVAAMLFMMIVLRNHTDVSATEE